MSFVYDQLEPLDPSEHLKPGDRIVIRFAWLMVGFYSRAAQWAAIEKGLEGRKDFEVVSYVNTELFLDVEIEVKAETMDKPGWGWGFLQPQSVVAVGTGAVIVVTAKAIMYSIIAICVYLAFTEVRKIRRAGPIITPEMKTMVSGIGAVGYAVLIGVIYIVLKGVKVIK